MIPKNKAFLFFSLSFLLGIFLNNITFNINKTLLVLLFMVILFFIYYVFKRKYFSVIVFISIWFLLWILLSQHTLQDISNKNTYLMPYLDNSKENLTFEIKNVYKKEEFQNQYIASLYSISWKKVEYKIYCIIILPTNFELNKWYLIKAKWKLYSIKNFDNFNYKNYLVSKNIYFKSYINHFDIIEKKEINSYYKSLYKIRANFLNIINKIYTKEEAIFLWWILLWAREEMPQNLKNDFNNSWLTHFIAVSWFNITILVIFLSYLLTYFPIFIRTILITFTIVSFTILVWDTAPVIRASIMWLIWYYIIISGRENSSLSLILLTAIIMVLFSPFSLNYDISFHLSFLAVIWIVYTGDFFKKIFYFLPETLAIKEAFILTIASLTFTLPIIIFNFGQISLLSPVANVLVTWTIPLAMLFWFLSIIVYFVFPTLWVIIWYLTWILLKWDILIVHYFWQASWAILEFEFWILKNYLEILYFLILVFLIIYFKWTKKENT